MKNGFTLLEILLVLGIMALVFFPLLSMFSSGLLVSGEIEGTATALHLAQQKLEAIKNLPFDSVSSEAKTAVENFPGYEREVTVTSPQADLKDVAVKVYWTVRGSELNVTLQTLVANL